MTYTKKSTAIRIEKILQLLVTPMNVHDISRETSISLTWGRKYLQHMVEQKMIHICSWKEHASEKSGRIDFIAHYKVGKGYNRKKPKRDAIQRQQARRKRIYADPEAYAAYVAMNRKYRWHNKVRRDKLVGALFGNRGKANGQTVQAG